MKKWVAGARNSDFVQKSSRPRRWWPHVPQNHLAWVKIRLLLSSMEFWFHYFIKQIVTKLLICAKPFYWELDCNGVMNESFPAGDHNLLEKAKAVQHYRNTLKGDAQTPRGGGERPRKSPLPDTQPKLQFSRQSGIMGRSQVWMLRNLGSVSPLAT